MGEKMKSKSKPFTYYRSLEEIRAYQKVPAHEKLKWLEEANIFLYRAMTKKAKKIREKFRRGAI